jgi:hypothetical protein
MLQLEQPGVFGDLLRRHLAWAVSENARVPESPEQERA